MKFISIEKGTWTDKIFEICARLSLETWSELYYEIWRREWSSTAHVWPKLQRLQPKSTGNLHLVREHYSYAIMTTLVRIALGRLYYLRLSLKPVIRRYVLVYLSVMYITLSSKLLLTLIVSACSVVALTMAARENNYVRPDLTEENVLIIKNGRCASWEFSTYQNCYPIVHSSRLKLCTAHYSSIISNQGFPSKAGMFSRRWRLTVSYRMTQILAAKVLKTFSSPTCKLYVLSPSLAWIRCAALGYCTLIYRQLEKLL